MLVTVMNSVLDSCGKCIYSALPIAGPHDRLGSNLRVYQISASTLSEEESIQKTVRQRRRPAR